MAEWYWPLSFLALHWVWEEMVKNTIHYVTQCLFTGVGMYYAGYNDYHPPCDSGSNPPQKLDVSQELRDEVSAERIGGWIK